MANVIQTSFLFKAETQKSQLSNEKPLNYHFAAWFEFQNFLHIFCSENILMNKFNNYEIKAHN